MQGKIKFRMSLEKMIYILLGVFLFVSIVMDASLLKYAYNISSLISNLMKIVRILLGICCIMSLRKISEKQFIDIMICSIIIVLSYYYTASYTFFDLFFVVFFCRCVNYKKIVNVYFYVIMLSLVCTVILYFMNIFPEFYIYRSNGVRRLTLGFSHPNVLGRIIFLLCLLYVIKKERDLKVYHLIFFSFVSLWVYIYPNSISSALMIILIVIIEAVNMAYKKMFKSDIIKSWMFRCFAILLIPILIIGVFYIVVTNTGENILSDFSVTFYKRFLYGMEAFKTYGISLFGQRVKFVGQAMQYFVGGKYFVIDCLYILLPLQYGIIPSLYFLLVYIKGIKNCIKYKDVNLLIAMLILAIYSISENGLAVGYSAFVFILSCRCLEDNYA